MKKIYFIFIFFVSTLTLVAQDYLYQADLPKVDSTGYYHIYLPPTVTSKLNYKFSDIRIFDNKNKEVPYIRLSEDELYKTAESISMNIIQNDYKKTKKYTLLLIENNTLKTINNLVLVSINPNNSEAWINIAGSNDLKNWNVLKNNARYMPEFSDSSTTQIRLDDLPESNFKYYRLMVYDYNKVVFKINKVLNFDIAETNIEFIEVPAPTFVQDDTSESNTTIVQINFSEPQYIDKIWFGISKPNNYLRKAEIAKKDSTSGKRIRLQFYDQNQKDFYLCSDSTNELMLSRYYAKKLFLVVNNNDDNPLKFADIKAYQQKEYIVASLKKNTSYKVVFGNPNVPPPIYDLKFFKNNIPPVCPVIEVTNIEQTTDVNGNSKTVKIKPVYLWIVFFIVILILAGISVKMFIFSKNGNKENFEDIF